MLWSVTGRSVASLVHCQPCPGAIVNLAILLLLAVVLAHIQAALPPGAEDEIVLIEHLPGRRVHLQDFFWTGVEDAPSWLDPEQILTLYETRTLQQTATVYVPGRDRGRPEEDARPPLDCASCIEPTPTLLDDLERNGIGVLVGQDPGPRYWLLTVLKAGESVPPRVELRLARLYKAAFARQQQRHLGLLPESRARQARFPRPPKAPKPQADRAPGAGPDNLTATTDEATDETTSSSVSLLRMRPVRIAKSKRTLPPVAAEAPAQLAGQLREAEREVGLVQVRMQNTSRIEGGATRLIYTVHLGGKPVPAESAAKDMALLSAQEVALELGAPVIIQSEPYLKESRPLALSRRRDAWLLLGAAGAGLVLLAVLVLGLLLLSKRKRAQSAVSAPPLPDRRVLAGKDEEYAPTTPGGIDNTAYTSETEAMTEMTSGLRRATPGSQDTIDIDARDILSENANPWDTLDYADAVDNKGRVQRANAPDRPRSAAADSLPDSRGCSGSGNAAPPDTLESLEKGFGAELDEATGSPHSYLSMPSCKQFPSMRSVEPLSKVLEPVVVKHLDLESDSPEMKIKEYGFKSNGEQYFARASSEAKDPGVLGPIVWDLKRKRAVEGNYVDATAAPAEADLEPGRVPHSGAVGRARRRLNELLEDSFSLFGTREPKQPREQQQQQQQQQQQRTSERRSHDTGQGPLQWAAPDYRGKSAHVSPLASPNAELMASRARTSLPSDLVIPETGKIRSQPRGAWASRPLSAGPFHRPNLPEVELVRVLADSQLRPEDPAVPLIAAIKKELGKFTYD
ncbi:uncharacterized protein LOC100679650 isoform X2 [Nasonia vitripennis]|uniref:Uncharacterized protein n=1 Tax=Nasonia vitripennis TaxID=7425 RepID=A0A7M7T8C8_NASVI|nr:uncharacterized protein LOC100679650 isoform X2 [Nasonia vitripennis]